MKELTEKQRIILDYIEDFIENEGMSPTVYEIADFFNIKTSTVFAHLRALQRKTYITRTSKARSISIRGFRKKPGHLSFLLPVPILGRINAGSPADNLEFKEGEIFVNTSMLAEKDVTDAFALKIQGQSMRDLGIYEDDIIIVVRRGSLKSGDIVVALVENETTVKSYFPLPGGRVELRPANAEFTSRIYPDRQVQIQGKVVGLQREY
ncbi:MAG: transcriptional repressor LexA [Victivallaceae bacterium]|nr:transcriptional repressor LexA [Victivallaceae bacterium]